MNSYYWDGDEAMVTVWRAVRRYGRSKAAGGCRCPTYASAPASALSAAGQTRPVVVAGSVADAAHVCFRRHDVPELRIGLTARNRARPEPLLASSRSVAVGE